MLHKRSFVQNKAGPCQELDRIFIFAKYPIFAKVQI